MRERIPGTVLVETSPGYLRTDQHYADVEFTAPGPAVDGCYVRVGLDGMIDYAVDKVADRSWFHWHGMETV